jgi:hypothetical protein
MSIGATQCTTSKWISTTSIMCNLPAGAGRSANATLSVSSQIGALPSWFTYDGELAAPSFVTSVVRVAVRSGLEV